ncbi:MAG: hypothetical protein ACTSXP_00040 [Promethearchaeota archaeon]
MYREPRRFSFKIVSLSLQLTRDIYSSRLPDENDTRITKKKEG